MKRNIVYLLLLSICLVGCSSGGADKNRVLEEADATIQEIKDFDALETEVITEQETEQETEVKKEESFVENYDFSEKVLDSLFTSVDHTKKIMQNPDTKERTETFSMKNGNVTITAIGNETSGNTFGSLDITCAGSDAENTIKQLLIQIDNGITEENYDKFKNGEYNENPGYIGLQSAVYEVKDQTFHAVLKKADVEKSSTPGWEEFAYKLSDFVGVKNNDTELNTEKDGFIKVLQSIDIGTVKKKSTEITSIGTLNDSDGSVKKLIDYNTAYHSDSGNSYDVKVSYSGTDADGVQIICKNKSAKDDSVIMELANHIYQCYFTGKLDTSSGLSDTYTKDNQFSVTKNKDGFTIEFK